MKAAHLFVLLALLSISPLAAADIEVLGLFKGAALIKIDGEQKLHKRSRSAAR